MARIVLVFFNIDNEAKSMKQLIRIILSISLVLMVSRFSIAAEPGRIYLVNATVDGSTVVGEYPGAGQIIAAPGEYPSCYSSDAVDFRIGLSITTLAPIDATNEGQFEKTLPGGETIKGTLETIDHLAPGVHSYYIYVWRIEGTDK